MLKNEYYKNIRTLSKSLFKQVLSFPSDYKQEIFIILDFTKNTIILHKLLQFYIKITTKKYYKFSYPLLFIVLHNSQSFLEVLSISI